MTDIEHKLGILIAEGSAYVSRRVPEITEKYSGTRTDVKLTKSGFEKYGTIENAVKKVVSQK